MPLDAPNAVRLRTNLTVQRTDFTWILITVKNAVLRGVTTEVIVLVPALVLVHMGITVIQRVAVNAACILATIRVEGTNITLILEIVKYVVIRQRITEV